MRSHLSHGFASAFRLASLVLLLLTASALAQVRVALQQQPNRGSANDSAPRSLTPDDAAPAKAPVQDPSRGESEAMGPGVQRSLRVIGSEQPLDLISSVPSNGIFMTGDDAPLQAEPILGPFHGLDQDLTRAQMVRYFSPTGDSNKGEYGTLLNARFATGFPEACRRNTFYPEGGTCLNDGGKMYRVKSRGSSRSYYGKTAAVGIGPVGTSENIIDGGVVWRYEPSYSPGNGGKTNLALMTYQEAKSGAAWTGAFAHQIASGGPKKTAFTLELDLNNYWGDYAGDPAGPTATALQIFMGGPNRSSKAIGIGQYDQPLAGSTSVVNGIEICCASLARDNTVLDLTESHNGYMNQGAHPGSAFTDGSASAISFNSYGGADIGFRHTGSSRVGLQLEGRYSDSQVQGQGWNVDPVGKITSSGETISGNSHIAGHATVGNGLSVAAGSFKPAQYIVTKLFSCNPETKGSFVVVTDLDATPTYRQTNFSGGGSIAAPLFCNGSKWEVH
ncbi:MULTISPECIES: hypothetical protein [Methylorubrum]|uniref:hypothetical protein n=1 Tax=Methylorubrum TaxID=2282523 RepID=UPI0020A1AEBC|nr:MULTISPECIES: hypothetical protein [Methylorubrum]MCP1548496.1 hypothetical protein [Methylorubrum zatmanii]MCP1554889.1 hypothetical protein [Methylorubrum extorquens]MCP1578799.1 hypothetical protein [Methylorubrum extorquens]